MLIDKLESKLTLYNEELNSLLNNKTMRDACFTSCGCGNRATQKKLTSYRNKIGDIGNKISALKLAIRIVKEESFTHRDILSLYNDFLQLRNPELYWIIYDSCLTFNAIKEVISLIINLFLPCFKKQVLNCNLIYDNENGNKFNISLTKTAQ